MTDKAPSLPSYPVWPTVIILALLATVGAVIGLTAGFAGSMTALSASHPLTMLIVGPTVIAGFATTGVLSLFLTPLWALAGGGMFASWASGNTGSAARQMGVTFFSETHPISKVTQRLAERMGLPPVAYIGWFPNEEINAFAMGTSRHNALVALSEGAIERLTKHELIAVIAHELGHIASNDMARMTLARSIQEALTFFLVIRGLKRFARWVFTPLSELELLRLSRAREFTADEIAATMIGAEPMIGALERIRDENLPPRTKGHANVLLSAGFSAGGLLSTHPPTDKRIARLRAIQAHRGTPLVPLEPMQASAAP